MPRKSAANLSTIRVDLAPTRRDQPPPPPDHLQPKTKAWWSLIASEFELEAYQYSILQAAGEAWDIYQFALAQLKKHGLTFTDKKGMIRGRPEAAIARDSRTSFLRALRELKLEAAPAPQTGSGRILKANARGRDASSWES